MSTNAKWIIGVLAVLVIVLLFVLLNGDDENIQNNIFFGLGLTIMLPPRAKITR